MCEKCGMKFEYFYQTRHHVCPSISAQTENAYAELRRILGNAYNQAAKGKGHQRHGNNSKFEDQQIVTTGLTLQSTDFNIGQVVKKALEGKHLSPSAAIHEYLGAINYLAGAILILEKLFPDSIKASELYVK